MTVMEMITSVKARTHDSDDTKVITELNAAQSWAFNRVYLTENGADVLVTINEQLTISVPSRSLNLENLLSFEVAGIKKLWLQLPTDNGFTQMQSVDTTDPRYAALDNLQTPEPAPTYPVLYYIGNYTQARFSCTLPVGSIVRVDYFRRPPSLDPTTNNPQTNGSDLPAAFHQAICENAAARRFSLTDDNKDVTWFTLADKSFQDALYHVQGRVQGPTVTQPFRRPRRRLY